MDALQRHWLGMRLVVGRHSPRAWFLWGIAALVLVVTPFALADPAAWVFLLDPELAAVVALVGFAGATRAVSRPLLAVARRARR